MYTHNHPNTSLILKTLTIIPQDIAVGNPKPGQLFLRGYSAWPGFSRLVVERGIRRYFVIDCLG